MKIVHLSDLHIKARGNDAVQAILRAVPPDAHVVVTGDVIDSGSSEELEQARALLEPLASSSRTVTVLPGNHDYGLLGIGYSKPAALAFDQDLARHLGCGRFYAKTPMIRLLEDQSARVQLIALNSCEETVSPHDLAGGELGEYQLSCLDDALAAPFPGGFKLVCLHHHPFDRGLGMALSDSDALWKTLRGRCQGLLFGHKHESALWRDRGGVKWVLASDATPRSGRARLLRFGESEVGFTVEDLLLATAA